MVNNNSNKRVAMFSIHSDPLAALGSQESGGQNIYVKYLAEELGKIGFDIDIFTRWDNARKKMIANISKHSQVIRLKGGPVGYIPKSDLFSIFPELCENFLKFIEFTNPYNLFHGHYWDGGFMAMEMAQKFRRPFVQNFHSIGIVRMETKKRFLPNYAENSYFKHRINLENKIVENASAIVSLAESEKQNLIKFYGCPEEKIHVLHGGVNINHWPLTEKKMARNEAGIEESDFVLLFVGRMEWRKGIGTLISVARLLRGKIPNLKLIIVGGKIYGSNKNSADLKEYQRLQKKCRDEKVEDLISFVGAVDHGRLTIYYRSADVFVIPSYYEPFGLVALEGMANKIPIVASDIDGLTATIKNKVSGLLFEPRNALSLAEKIINIYESNELRQALINNAYAEITKNYSWNKIAAKIGNLYNSLL